MTNICVFCSASEGKIDENYVNESKKLGELIAKKGYNLVYGGSQKGLMGEVAMAVKKVGNGSKVIGVLPEIFHHLAEIEDEAIKTKDLRDRKAEMELRSDAFIALPGGYGTLDEVADVLAFKSLEVHKKPIVLINIDNFFDKLLEYFEFIRSKGFINDNTPEKKLFFVANSAEEAMEYLNQKLS